MTKNPLARWLLPLILVLSGLGLAPISVGASGQAPSLLELLPAQSTQVSLATAELSEQDQKIGLKIHKAQEGDPEWFYHYALTHGSPGQPLPYHEKLGVTEEEYEDFLSSADRMTLREVGQAPLRVVRDELNITVVLDLDIPGSLFRDITFFLGSHKVKTPFGDLPHMKRVHQKEARGVLGPWKGLSWKREEGSLASGNASVIRVTLGQVVASKKMFVTYAVKVLREGVLEEHHDFQFMYDK